MKTRAALEVAVEADNEIIVDAATTTAKKKSKAGSYTQTQTHTDTRYFRWLYIIYYKEKRK